MGEGNSEATTTAASSAPATATANARASASIAVPPAAPAAPGAGNAMHGAMRIPPLHPSPVLAAAAAASLSPAAAAAATASAAAVVGSRWEQPYALIGHSMSAGMAMMFAATFPEHMHKVGRWRRPCGKNSMPWLLGECVCSMCVARDARSHAQELTPHPHSLPCSFPAARAAGRIWPSDIPCGPCTVIFARRHIGRVKVPCRYAQTGESLPFISCGSASTSECVCIVSWQAVHIPRSSRVDRGTRQSCGQPRGCQRPVQDPAGHNGQLRC